MLVAYNRVEERNRRDKGRVARHFNGKVDVREFVLRRRAQNNPRRIPAQFGEAGKKTQVRVRAGGTERRQSYRLGGSRALNGGHAAVPDFPQRKKALLVLQICEVR